MTDARYFLHNSNATAMTGKSLIMEIHQLPENLKQEALHFIAFLKKEYMSKPTETKPGKRVFGSAKGKYQLAPDFDEPLEDFKEYM